MKKVLIFISLLLALPAGAWWQSVPQGFVSGGGGGYTGPGDCSGCPSAANIVAWYSVYRCFSASYVGNVADIYAPADATHTLVTCTSGGVINETLQSLATTCAISCTIKTLYDQSGASACTATACNVIDNGVSTRPAIVLNAIGTAPGISCDGSMGLTSVNAVSQATPFSASMVAKQTTAGTFATAIGNGTLISGFHGANTGVMFNGSTSDISSVSDSSFHAMQHMYTSSGGTGAAYIDGSSTTGLSPGTGSLASNFSICARADNNFKLTGVVMEAGIWSGTFSGGEQSALNTNQHAAYGGW